MTIKFYCSWFSCSVIHSVTVFRVKMRDHVRDKLQCALHIVVFLALLVDSLKVLRPVTISGLILRVRLRARFLCFLEFLALLMASLRYSVRRVTIRQHVCDKQTHSLHCNT